jgi:hypothetical protein
MRYVTNPEAATRFVTHDWGVTGPHPRPCVRGQSAPVIQSRPRSVGRRASETD